MTTTNRQYEFGEGKAKPKKHASIGSAELRALYRQQRRWMTRIKRAVTAISKIERRIKRLE